MRNSSRMILVALLIAALSFGVASTTRAQDVPAVSLTVLGTYDSGLFDAEAAEIVAFDPGTRRAFVVNGGAKTIDILDFNDPSTPLLLDQIDVTVYGGGANSVDIHDGILAAAIEAVDKQANGSIVFFDMDGGFIASVEAGALPDMITFTPDGSKVLTANEGEPNDDYRIDPEGSITIVDISDGVESLSQANVTTADFTAFNDADLDPAIRVFGPGATVAQDLEPEYIAVSPDSQTAWITLQENNALAIVDLASSQVTDIVPLGFKDFNRPSAAIDLFGFTDLPQLGITEAGQEILLGGFSGLYFEGIDEETGNLQFITHPDRGPNADPVDVDEDGISERPFPLPDYQSQWVRFELDPASGQLTIIEQIGLTAEDGSPITGLPNLLGDSDKAYADEEPVDLFGNPLPRDPYGADMEGIVGADDGTYWMVDEYRPAIYHFDGDGTLIERFIPEGPDDEDAEIDAGAGRPALPAVFAQRRANRGFEAVTLHDGILYAFIQSPIDNPDTGNDASSKTSSFIRILAFDSASGETVGQYLYQIEGDGVDKIGDAVALDDGTMLVIERDSATGDDARKYIYRIDLGNATNIHGREDLPVGANGGLELQSELGLALAGIRPVDKQLYVDLSALGYTVGDKPEGLALIDDQTLAVINDNDFSLTGTFDPTTGLLDENPDPIPVVLGLISLAGSGLDASDKDDAINIQPWPVRGMYQPDAIAAYEVEGEVYLVTANEGDARDYDGYSEEARVADLVLDLAAFPDAVELQESENLGRLKTTTASGDSDGDGLFEEIFAFGGRSFSIWDEAGNLVYDSGDQIGQITAEMLPKGFNSSGENDSMDTRSDDKGAEPEAVTIGEIKGIPYAFIGLERVGGILVYDISDPAAPQFVQYLNNRDFSAESERAGDLAPEGIAFVAAADSPTGTPLLLVANEFSGTVTAYAIE